MVEKKEQVQKGYREFETRFDIEKYDELSKSVQILNRNFRIKDLFFEVYQNILRLNLNCVHYEKFETLILELNPETELSSLFLDILSQVQKVGSYGIKGKKRIYYGYNEERKIVGRKKIESQRSQGSNRFLSENEKDNILPQSFKNSIICGDSEVELKKIPDNSIDLIFTSPPYNFGLGYDLHEDGVHWDEYFQKLFDIFSECIRVLKNGGRLIVNIQPFYSDYIPSHHIISTNLISQKLLWKGEIIWEKNNYNCKYTSWGSWKSPSSPYLKYTWEYIEVFCKGSLTKKGDKSNIDITGDEFKKWVVAKWSIAPERKMKVFGHPAMFPEELVERVLKLFSYENDIILDPFNGVGTTTLVARKLNRVYIGIDTSPDYCNVAEKRTKEIL